MFLTEEKLEKRIEQLEGLRYRFDSALSIAPFRREPAVAHASGAAGAGSNGAELNTGEAWRPGGADTWLDTVVKIPEAWRDEMVVGLLQFSRTGSGFASGVEAMVYLDGEPYQGIDANHQELYFGPQHAGASVELSLRVWGGEYGHRADDPVPVAFRLETAVVTTVDAAADDLYFTAQAAHRSLAVLPEGSWERTRLETALDAAFLLLDWRRPGSDDFYRSVADANSDLHRRLAALRRDNPVEVSCVGHSHIDVAWLWRLSDTREKAARTFSTVLRLMERFPEYVFLQTQPQLYEYLDQDYPAISQAVAARVAEGRWEAAGGMWIESDCNVPSGESLVRQLLYGTREFERRFGSRCEYLWLPDVFGYSWALPQILVKSGIHTFMTTKISWNVYNRFPHDTFFWRGVDGTEILTHFITTPNPKSSGDTAFNRFYTYNGQVLPETVSGIWDNYQDKGINDRLLLSFGWGDGGGGPTREMLELRRRLEDMPGLPRVTTGRADEYFRDLRSRIEETDGYVHRWDGELYLELHRGTYTSQAYNKRMNRRMENRLRSAEMVGAVASVFGGDFARESIRESWKIVLRNQFHDILPGSSIAEVYQDCRVEYAEAERLADSALTAALRRLGAADVTPGSAAPGAGDEVPSSFLVFNTLSWTRSECVEVPWCEEYAGASWTDGRGAEIDAERVSRDRGDTVRLFVRDIPAVGYTVLERGKTVDRSDIEDPTATPFTVTDRGATTPFYELEWDESGALSRVFDRRRNREVVAPGAVANRFDVHEDKPVAHEAWEIDIFYTEKVRHIDALESVSVVENGRRRAVVRFRWTYERSTVEQDMVLFADHGRIDFVTRVDWQERQQLLKVAFPVVVRATEATYEIQFGTVRRPTHWNTSWDYARFETCAQRWIDLSERGFGVSIMNDCKYGHDVRENVMRVTLIKSGILPDPEADRGAHEFTYSFLCHDGDWFEGGTLRHAHQLNAPLIVTPVEPADALPPTASFVAIDSDHVVVDTLKPAEDSDAWILRCYECAGARGEVEITTYLPLLAVQEVNLLERDGTSLEHGGDRFSSRFGPYEIKTFLLQVARHE